MLFFSCPSPVIIDPYQPDTTPPTSWVADFFPQPMRFVGIKYSPWPPPEVKLTRSQKIWCYLSCDRKTLRISSLVAGILVSIIIFPIVNHIVEKKRHLAGIVIALGLATTKISMDIIENKRAQIQTYISKEREALRKNNNGVNCPVL